jgi:hypothetical protein
MTDLLSRLQALTEPSRAIALLIALERMKAKEESGK